jgi:hypothetical protein
MVNVISGSIFACVIKRRCDEDSRAKVLHDEVEYHPSVRYPIRRIHKNGGISIQVQLMIDLCESYCISTGAGVLEEDKSQMA